MEIQRFSDPDDREEGKKVRRFYVPHVLLTNPVHFSALSLRVFGEDITAAARQSGQKKQQAPSQPVVEDSVAVEDVVEEENGTTVPEEE